MKIICGTDLSNNCRQTLAAANRLALQVDAELEIVHVMHDSLQDRLAQATRELHEGENRGGLKHLAENLDPPNTRVTTQLLHGHADEKLVTRAADEEAELLVVGSHAYRDRRRWRLGSSAERVAESSFTPTLVVRRDGLFDNWNKDNPVKIFFAWSFDESCDNALRWLNDWCRCGPCEITVVHVDWPPEEARRLGVRTDHFKTRNEPLVQEILEREVREQAGRILTNASFEVLVVGDYSRPEFMFERLVEEQQPDLVVTGAHQRRGLRRLGHDSFTRHLLHNCRSSMILVPLLRRAPEPVPHVRHVLVATDLSELGNHAIPQAFALAQPGATVHLLHVVPENEAPNPDVPAYLPKGSQARELERELTEHREQLVGLIPEEIAQRGLFTEVHVVGGNDVAAAICQQAERLGADLICLGSHGRSGLSGIVLGSVANAVIAHTHRPVTVVRPKEHGLS